MRDRRHPSLSSAIIPAYRTSQPEQAAFSAATMRNNPFLLDMVQFLILQIKNSMRLLPKMSEHIMARFIVISAGR